MPETRAAEQRARRAAAKTPTALRALITQRGLTNEAVAVLAGVDPATVSLIVNGRRAAAPATIVRLAKALGVSARRMQYMTDAARAAGIEADRQAAGPAA